MLDKVKKLHEKGWTLELRWGFYCGEPHFMVIAMKELKRYQTMRVNLNSVEEAFDEVYRWIEEEDGEDGEKTAG